MEVESVDYVFKMQSGGTWPEKVSVFLLICSCDLRMTSITPETRSK